MVLVIVEVLAIDARAATLNVGATQTYASIAEALEVAVAGDTIEVDPGSYPERSLQIGIDLTITGTGGSAGTTWTTNGNNLLMRIESGATVTVGGFTFVPPAGAPVVLVEGTLTADDWLVTGTSETPIAVNNGTLTLTNSVLDGNTGTNLGGHVVAIGGSVTVVDSTLSSGSAPQGGAIYAQGAALVLDGARIETNHADDSGGGVSVVDGSVTADETLFRANDATGVGGGVGGGLVVSGAATFALSACEFTDNTSDSSGGAMEVLDAATGTVDGSSFTTNTSGYGGALYASASGDLQITGSEFVANEATAGNGGAIRIRSTGEPEVTITTTLFNGNSASAFGGALATATESGVEAGSLVLDEDWFAENTAANGGAMSLADTASIDASHLVLCANEASADGGGVRVTGSGATKNEWTNTLFSDNVAGGAGGALLLDASGPTAILSDAFLGNDAQLLSGGGISSTNTQLALLNTLVAYTKGGNGIADDVVGGSLSVDYSLFFDNAASNVPAFTGGTGNVFGDDPQLAAYTSDGDCTNDQPWPVVGSPLVDAGDPAYSDPDGSRSDIGVYGGPQADWSDFEDADEDGFLAANDCDDGNPDVNPDGIELCNEIDDDCDGEVDVDAVDGATWWLDDDGDGYGIDTETAIGCTAPPGYASAPGDCDDAAPAVHPNAEEACNALDDNCDGGIDEGVVPTWYPDADADGYGAGDGTASCTPLDGQVDNDGDCDDADPEQNPDAQDPPGDGVDSNCDGLDGVADAGPGDKDEDLLAGGGCACDQQGSGVGAAALALAMGLVARRRGRRSNRTR